jgi:phosphoenolpyruvate carboxykinase (ATP)
MPPIARLSPEQAMYHFISGYTSKVGGTEIGLSSEPQITFSACFGGPFMVHHPMFYADLLARKMKRYGATCWLVNTGWYGGAYGVGKRYPLPITRRLIHAAINGELDHIPMEIDPIFELTIPSECTGVAQEFLHPWKSWSRPELYRESARKLLAAFRENEKNLYLIQH